MGTGYTRNDTLNNIADGNIINASDLDGEFDAVESAFNESTGHTHDGTAAEGAPITVLGPVQDFVASATEIKPKTTNTLDIGTVSLQFKDMYLDGTAYLDDIQAVGAVDITGDLDVDNININGNTISSTDTNGDITLDPNGTGDTIIASGNVGIGTAAPAHLVDAINTAGSATARFGSTYNIGANDGTVIIGNGGSGDAMLRFDYEGTNTDRARIGVTSSGQQLEFYTAGDNERMRIDSSGNVGIGGSPSRKLHVIDSGDTYVAVQGGTSSKAGIFFGDSDNHTLSRIRHDNTDNSLQFMTNEIERMRIDSSGRVGIGRTPTITNSKLEVGGADNVSLINVEASGVTGGMGIGSTGLQFFHGSSAKMRIDSSGNLLVGKTSASGSAAGAEMRAAGTVIATVDGDYPLYLNRLTSDGDIAQFRKDGTLVGSIGNRDADDIFINTAGGTGSLSVGGTEYYAWSSGAIYPWTDNARNLGGASVRWQDLYLSGGVYLGGTAAANKLDDYEEGTWTPAFCDASSGGNEFGYTGALEAFYTKVGSMVTVWFYGRTDGSTAGITTANQLFVQGLPFTSNMVSNGTANSVKSSTQGTLQATTGPIFARVKNGVTYLAFEKQFGDASAPYSFSSLLISEWEGGYGANITGFITYKTDS